MRSEAFGLPYGLRICELGSMVDSLKDSGYRSRLSARFDPEASKDAGSRLSGVYTHRLLGSSFLVHI